MLQMHDRALYVNLAVLRLLYYVDKDLWDCVCHHRCLNFSIISSWCIVLLQFIELCYRSISLKHIFSFFWGDFYKNDKYLHVSPLHVATCFLRGHLSCMKSHIVKLYMFRSHKNETLITFRNLIILWSLRSIFCKYTFYLAYFIPNPILMQAIFFSV